MGNLYIESLPWEGLSADNMISQKMDNDLLIDLCANNWSTFLSSILYI